MTVRFPPSVANQNPSPRMYRNRSSENFGFRSERPAPLITSQSIETSDEPLYHIHRIIEDEIKEQIEKIALNCINEHKFDEITIGNSKLVMQAIHVKRREAAHVKLMNVAHECDEAVKEIMSICADIRLHEIQMQRQNAATTNLMNAENEYNAMREHWARVIEKAKEFRDADLIKLTDRQEAELEEAKKIYNGDPPSTFRKFSPKIIEKRHTMKQMGSVGQLSEASRLKKEIEAMEAEELEQIRVDWKKHGKQRLAEMQKKNAERYLIRDQQWTTEINKMILQSQKEIDALKKTLSHREEKFDQTDRAIQETSAIMTPRYSMSARTPRNLPLGAFSESQATFKQRKMVTNILYTNPTSPRVKKLLPK